MNGRLVSEHSVKCFLVFWLIQSLTHAHSVSHAIEPVAQNQRSSGEGIYRIEELAELPLEELAKIRVTSIATGTQEPVPEAPAVASVLTADEIAAMGATTLDEALESLPGFHVARGESYGSLIQVRGISTKYNSQILVMLNGIPITSLFRGDRNRLEGLPIAMISRIEVIRGPGSALYGADAVAGVVNIITKEAAEIKGTETGGRIGSFDTREAWVRLGETNGELKLSLMADYQETSGHKRVIEEDAQSRFDRLLGTRASLAPGPVNISEKMLALLLDAQRSAWRLRGSCHLSGDRGTGQGVGEALDPNGRFKHSRTLMELIYHDSEWRRDWDLTSQVSFLHGSQELDRNLWLFPPGANLGQGAFPDGVIGNPEFWERQVRFDNSALYTGFKSHRIRVGAGYFFGDLYQVQESKNFDPNTFAPRPVLVDVTDTPEIYIPEESRSSYYGFAQDEWRLAEDWNLTLGVRYDHDSDYGDTVNPRTALVWKTTPELNTKFLYGRAFRRPTFVELFTINNPVALGNPNLQPEFINVYEIAWAYQAARDWSAGLNFFYYKAENLIAFRRDPGGLTTSAQNFGVQTGRGLEFETKLRALPALVLTGNYSYVEATDERSGRPAADYPNHKIYVRGDWALARNWTAGPQLTRVGTRERAPTDSRPSLRGYTSVDLVLRRTGLLKGLDLGASVRNLFNADIREPSLSPGSGSTTVAIPNDLPQAGRSAYLELTYRF